MGNRETGNHTRQRKKYFDLGGNRTHVQINTVKINTNKYGKNQASAKACREDGHHISLTRETTYGCFLLVFGS